MQSFQAPDLGKALRHVRDAEQMEDVLRSVWGAESFSTAETKNFHAACAQHRFDRVDIAHCYYATPATALFDNVPVIRQQFVLGGSGVTEVGRRQNAVSRAQSCVLPSNVRTVLNFGDEFDQFIVRIPERTLETTLARLMGVLPRGPLRFSVEASSGSNYERLRRSLMMLMHERAVSETSSLVTRELEETFVVQFLLSNQHNHLEALLTAASPATPKQVQIVEEFIEANWDKPLTIEDIARVTDTPVRTIYSAFKRYRGYGPKTFLRQVRLNKARELLQQGRHSVSAVAGMCGFPSAGRFSRYYRAAFGELPSDTRR